MSWAEARPTKILDLSFKAHVLFTEGLLQSFRIVQIEYDAFFAGLNLRYVLCVGPDHFAGSDLWRSGEQFYGKRSAKDHGVSALSPEGRQHDLFLGGIKFLDKLGDEKIRYQRMIYGT